MKSIRPIQGALVLWALWELINGALSTFSPPQGASLVGWVPKGGWTGDLFLISQQYGMVMVLLGVLYAVIATDPLRFRPLVWIAVVEQGLGILYALGSTFGAHTLTLGQFLTQAVINIVIAAVFVLLRPAATETGAPRRARVTV